MSSQGSLNVEMGSKRVVLDDAMWKWLERDIADSEDGRSPQATGCGQPLEAEKGKETYSSLDLPERNIALQRPWL